MLGCGRIFSQSENSAAICFLMLKKNLDGPNGRGSRDGAFPFIPALFCCRPWSSAPEGGGGRGMTPTHPPNQERRNNPLTRGRGGGSGGQIGGRKKAFSIFFFPRPLVQIKEACAPGNGIRRSEIETELTHVRKAFDVVTARGRLSQRKPRRCSAGVNWGWGKPRRKGSAIRTARRLDHREHLP